MGANEARHVLSMADDLGKVLALELITAAQALNMRRDMINAARDLADRADAVELVAKVQGGPQSINESHGEFLAEVEALRVELSAAEPFHPGRAVAAAHESDPAPACRSSNATARWMSTSPSRWCWSAKAACWRLRMR